MDKLPLTFLFFFCVQLLCAQTIRIPDDKLKQVLIGSKCADFDGDGELDGDVDANDDKEISKSEAEAVIG